MASSASLKFSWGIMTRCTKTSMHMSATLLLVDVEESPKISRSAVSDSFMISFLTYCRRFLLTPLISAETLHGVNVPCSEAPSSCIATAYNASSMHIAYHSQTCNG